MTPEPDSDSAERQPPPPAAPGAADGAGAAASLPPPPSPVSPAAEAPGAFLPVPLPRLLRRFSHLLVLTALLAIPLAYPLKITDGLDYAITRKVIGQSNPALLWVWLEQAQVALFSGYSPLVLKRYVWALLTLILAWSHLAWKLLPQRRRESAEGERRVSWEAWAAVAFLTWGALSIFFWLPQAEGGSPRGAGFLKGLDVGSEIATGLGFFLLASDLFRRRRWVYKGMGLLMAGAALSAILALAQRSGWAEGLLPVWDPTQIRNRMSSVIGHNTGLSAYLIAPFLLSLAWGLTQWKGLSRGARWGYTAFWALMILTITMAQSRAVILLLLAAVPILLWTLHRTVGLSIGRSWIGPVAVIAILILGQFAPGRWNPLYDSASPLAGRTRDLSVERLKAETRLRITVCSLPLIAQFPLWGTGLGSFQYVYPQAQGLYFEMNPGTLLVPTGKRTERAHNEYLQILVELGLVGLGLALWGLAVVLRRGSKAYARSIRPADIPIQAALMVSMGCLLIHAAADFPLRVAPVAVSLVWMLAVWNAGERIWLPRKARPEETPPDGAGAGAPPLAQGDPVLWGARLTPAARGWLWGAGVAALALLLITASSWFSRRMVADTLAERARRMFVTFLDLYQRSDPETRLGILGRMENDLRRALVLRPADGELHFLKAYANYFQAQEAYLQSEAAARAGEEAQAQLWKTQALSRCRLALASLNVSLNEVRFHQSFHIRGKTYRLMAELTGDPREILLARRDLERAVSFTPAYHEGLLDLLNLLSAEFPGEREERLRLLELLYRWNPGVFREQFMNRAAAAFADERYAEAAERFRELAAAAPNDPELLSALATTYMQAGEFEEVERALGQMSSLSPRPVEYYVISAALAIERAEWERARSLLEQALRQPEGGRELYRILLYLTLEKLGEEEKARAGLEAMERRARSNPRVYLDFTQALVDRFHDLPRAIPYIERYIETLGGRPPDPKLSWYLARYAFDYRDQPEKALEFLGQALKVNPRHGPSLELKRRIEERLRKTAPAPAPASPQP